jgi:hypothetical protein
MKVERRADSGANDRQVEKRHASDAMIRQALTDVYDDKENCYQKPPNVREVVKPVQEKLARSNHSASGQRIQKIASLEPYASQRRPPGRTVASEKREKAS